MRSLIAIYLMLLASWPSLPLKGQEVIAARRRVVATGPCSSLPYTPNWSGSGSLTTPWNFQTSGSTWPYSSGALSPTSFGSNIFALITGCTGFGTSQYAQVTVNTASGYAGIVVNGTSDTAYYAVWCTPGAFCYGDNSTSNLGPGTKVLSASTATTFCVEVAGTTMKLKFAGVYDTTTWTVSGVSGGQPGLSAYVGSGVVSFSSFSAGNGTCP